VQAAERGDWTLYALTDEWCHYSDVISTSV